MEVPYIQTTEDTVKSTLCETKLNEAELTRIIQSSIENVEVICRRPLLRIMRAKNMALSTNCELFKSLTPEEQGAAKSHHHIVVNGKTNQGNNCILDPLMQGRGWISL
jgi:hypothetical protein